jgi:uncharacterized protein YeeX (DUF496 family)
MTLDEILQIVDKFSLKDKQQLREYLEREERKQLANEKIRRLDAGFAAMRQGLSEADLDAITHAMNEEYIEPTDKADWTE